MQYRNSGHADPRKKVYRKGLQDFNEYYQSLPPGKRGTVDYNLRRAFELAPKEELAEYANNPKAHLKSFYFNEEGVGEFMKSPNHKSVNKELDFYYSDTDEAKEFRSKYDLIQDKSGYKYVPKRTELMDMPRGRIKPYRKTIFDYFR